MKFRNLLICIIVLVGCNKSQKQPDYVDYVNPLIGTAPSTTISALKHGHGSENNAQVVPFVTTPFAMTNWTPQTKPTEQKCHAPYYYTDSIIQGFRGSHWLSGSCVQEYGSMTIMPISGKLKCLPEKRGSKYSHQLEKATPYSYTVKLTDYNIDAEMTATKRSGILKFQFNNEGAAHIVINPNSDEGQGYVEILPEQKEIIGYNPAHRIYQGWGQAAGFSGYFVARFSQGFKKYGVYQADNLFPDDTKISNMPELGAFASFTLDAPATIYVTIGTSFTSIEQARKNLDQEINNRSFAEVKKELKGTWEKLLGQIKVEGTNKDDKMKFYTALYHSFLHPRTFSDCDGSYPTFAGGDTIVKQTKGHDYFVDFSMWDTYRASHPLFNLLTPKHNASMMYSLLNKAEQGGWLPIFPCWNSYTSAMIGDHVIATIADAKMKGVIDINDEQYQYLLQNAFKTPESFEDYKQGKGRRALTSYMKYGYVPLEDSVKESFHFKEQVSRTLEYAFDDFALSQIAKTKKDSAHLSKLEKRALNYKNVFSKNDSCVKGRYANGEFIEEFDKYKKQFFITEGTPYQYTWYVPHDVAGLIELFGSEDDFNKKLDEFHETGQYWHGNEPGHQIPFMYNYSGEPWKTQKVVTNIMKTEYGVGPGGLSGNDDAGQMSAWYVFAALGFYPVCPSVPEYAISGPHFDKITIQLENGKKLIINAPGASEGRNYIQELKVNGRSSTKNYLNHFDITKGGTLDFVMGTIPNREWGTKPEDRPFSFSKPNK